eukprot:1148441-Pelagomonas_calceolata.AAC.10
MITELPAIHQRPAMRDAYLPVSACAEFLEFIGKGEVACLEVSWPAAAAAGSRGCWRRPCRDGPLVHGYPLCDQVRPCFEALDCSSPSPRQEPRKIGQCMYCSHTFVLMRVTAKLALYNFALPTVCTQRWQGIPALGHASYFLRMSFLRPFKAMSQGNIAHGPHDLHSSKAMSQGNIAHAPQASLLVTARAGHIDYVRGLVYIVCQRDRKNHETNVCGELLDKMRKYLLKAGLRVWGCLKYEVTSKGEGQRTP